MLEQINDSAIHTAQFNINLVTQMYSHFNESAWGRALLREGRSVCVYDLDFFHFAPYY